MTAPLILKRVSTSRCSDEWSGDDYDVLADGVVVGRESCSGPAHHSGAPSRRSILGGYCRLPPPSLYTQPVTLAVLAAMTESVLLRETPFLCLGSENLAYLSLLIATALDDPQAMSSENKAFRGINFADLQTAYRQFCKNKKVTVPAVDLAEVIDHYNKAAADLPGHTKLKGIKLPGASVVLDRKGERFAEVSRRKRRLLADLQPGWHCRAAGSRAS